MLLLTVISAAPAVAADAPAIFPGQALAEALLELEAQGLPIVFTDRLVRPEMRVTAAPLSADLRQVLDELLAPHGLAVEAVDGTLVVVATPAAPGSIRGTVRAHASSRPLAGVVIEVAGLARSATSDDAGRFELPDLPTGTYDLSAHLTGFLTAEARRVSLVTAGPVEVDFELRPLPFVDDEIVVRPSRLALLLEEAEAPLTLTRRDVENLPHLGRDVFRALFDVKGSLREDVFHDRVGGPAVGEDRLPRGPAKDRFARHFVDAAEVGTIEKDASRSGFLEADEMFQQGAFPAAARATVRP